MFKRINLKVGLLIKYIEIIILKIMEKHLLFRLLRIILHAL